MRATFLAVLVAVVGACSGEATMSTPPGSVGPVDSAGAALLAGTWSMPDGDGCTWSAGFDGSALLQRACYPGDGTAQVSRIYGPFEARMNGVADTGPTVFRWISVTAKDASCPRVDLRGSVLAFDVQITGNSMVLDDTDGSRSLLKSTAQGPAVDRILLGCFSADGTFYEPVPLPE